MGLAKEFREFAVKGNAVDMAVGIIIGVAFGKVISSLVSDVIMPPIGMVLGNVDFSGLFINLGSQTYTTLAEAKKAGAPTLNYGIFIQAVLDFLIIAAAVFALVKGINMLRRTEQEQPAEEPKPREEVVLLSEIRDSLASIRRIDTAL